MIFLLVVLASNSTSAVEIDLSKTLHFAQKLEQENDYYRAITEYKRYWFYSQNKPDSIIYHIAGIYIKEDLPDNAVDILKYIKDRDSTYTRIYATSYFRAGDYEKARELWGNKTFTGLTYLYQRKFGKAGEYLGNIGKPDRKSPFLGAVFSVFPGGGKFYAGRKFDGIMSLVSVVSLAIPAYYAYTDTTQSKIKAYIYGGISLFFYLGDIYGGWIAVKVYNDKAEENFVHSVAVDIKWDY